MNAVQAGQANWIQQLRQQQRQYAAAARASWLFYTVYGLTRGHTPAYTESMVNQYANYYQCSKWAATADCRDP